VSVLELDFQSTDPGHTPAPKGPAKPITLQMMAIAQKGQAFWDAFRAKKDAQHDADAQARLERGIEKRKKQQDLIMTQGFKPGRYRWRKREVTKAQA
jgi:hypothetical protein